MNKPNAPREAPLFPSVETVRERIKYWDDFNTRYENMNDDEAFGYDLETIVAMEEAKEKEEWKAKKTSKGGPTLNRTDAILKSIFDEADDEDSGADSEEEFVEEEESEPDGQQLVPYQKRDEKDLWNEVTQHFGTNFIQRMKQEAKRVKEELSKLNIPSWDLAVSNSLFHETFNENYVETPGFKSCSRQYERRFEQNNCTMRFNGVLPSPMDNLTFNSAFNSTNRRAMNEMQNQSAMSLCPPLMEGFPKELSDILRAFQPVSSIKVVEREYQIDGGHHGMITYKPDFQVKAEIIEISDSEDDNGKLNSSNTNSQVALFGKPLAVLQHPKKADKAARRSLFQEVKPQSVAKSPRSPGRFDKGSADADVTKSKAPKQNQSRFSPKGSADVDVTKSKAPKQNQSRFSPKGSADADVTKTQHPQVVSTSYWEKSLGKETQKVVTGQETLDETKNDLPTDGLPDTQLDCHTKTLNLSEISIGSSYCTDSSDEEFFNKQKFNRLRQMKQEEHKKKKLQERTLKNREANC